MKHWQLWNLKNCPPADKREYIEARWTDESNVIELVNKSPGNPAVFMARIYVNPGYMASLARDIADLVSEAQKAGYLEAQRDMREALGL